MELHFSHNNQYACQIRENLEKLSLAPFLHRTLKFINKILMSHSDWSTLEKEMGDGLQKSGHYMDRYM